jgi:hypothetical protein
MIDAKTLRLQRRKLVFEAQAILKQEDITVVDKLKFEELMNAADVLKLQEEQARGIFSDSSFVN